MALTVVDVPARPVLPAFEQLIGPDRTARLHEAAEAIRDRLAGGILWHVNSTPAGGGVAEMLHTLLPIYAELGVPARWAVIGGDDAFFQITKRLGVALYGSDGDGGPLDGPQRSAYLRSLSAAARQLADLVNPGDVVVLHDHQSAGLVAPLSARGAEVHWRCHVGVDEPTPAAQRGWDFIAPMLDGCRSLIFSVDRHVPARFRDRTVQILPPFIAPFGYKNCALEPDAVNAILAHCGLGPGRAARPAVPTPLGTVALRSAPTVLGEGPRPDEPLITQVSRWDRLKDMAGVMQAVVEHTPHGHLALVGPDPAAIADDVEQLAWYTDCVERRQALPAAARRRVTLVSLPMADLAENAVLVNAIQRASTVVVQKSLAEGFGLTVAEAMWKHRVVVASAVGGIRSQITDRVDGLLLADPADLPGLGRLITEALAGEVDAIDIGARAHQRVHTDFLADREVATTAAMITKERVTIP